MMRLTATLGIVLVSGALACSRQTERIPADSRLPSRAAVPLASAPASESPASEILTITLDIEHMHCQYCERNVDTTLAALDGVLASRSDRTKKQTVVTLDPAKISPEDVAAAVKTAPGMSGKPGQYSATVAAK